MPVWRGRRAVRRLRRAGASGAPGPKEPARGDAGQEGGGTLGRGGRYRDLLDVIGVELREACGKEAPVSDTDFTVGKVTFNV